MDNFELQVKRSLFSLMDYVEKENFRGYDPYDAMNSPLLKKLSGNSKYLRIFYIQLLKKLPINIRPWVGIEKGLNPKGLGLFLWGYARLFRAFKNERYLENVHLLLDLLKRTRSEGFSGNCWGYNFNWQSRAFYVPKFTPTIVNTAFIGHALIDTFSYTGLEKAIDLASSIKDFILNDLNRTTDGDCFCFSYTPIDRIAVHNANLLGASLLIRLNAMFPDSTMKDSALSALNYSLKHQRPDGSWYYAETNYQGWIDSFHTGFNLQSLHYFNREGFETICRDAFFRGIDFYTKHFFLNDGTPKYYHDRLYPLDIHSPGQAVALFSLSDKNHWEMAKKILGWMLNNMRDDNGYFYFQKTPFFTNRIPYMRWAQAWAFHAITSFLTKDIL